MILPRSLRPAALLLGFGSLLCVVPDLLADGEAPIARGKFKDFGPPAAVSTHRGAVAVETPDGPKLMMNLADWTGGYGVVLVSIQTGRSEFFPYPVPNDDAPFAVLYSSQGRFYTQFGHKFYEFDPVKRAFTFHVPQTKDRAAMMMTEDDHGVVWMATYPQAHLMSFNPKTREFKEHGSLNQENWPQYPRSLAVDDSGWVYAGIAHTRCQIVAFHPPTGKRVKIVPEEERVGGSFDIRSPFHSRATQGTVWRATDGKVYGRMPQSPDRPWFRLHQGKADRVETVTGITPRLEVAGSQFVFQNKIPGGGEIVDLDVPKGTFAVRQPDGGKRRVRFSYPSAGARIASLTAGPDGRLYGSTGHPLQFFALDPATGKYSHAPDTHGGHINAIATMGNAVYGAIYTQGVLVRHDATDRNAPLNTVRLTQAGETVLRPFDLIGLANGRELVMVGSPGYGLTGGGMLFYDLETKETTILSHKDVVPDQSTKTLVQLPDGSLLGGTSIEAGTGGEPVAKEATLYIMELPGRKVVFNKALLPGVPQYRDMMLTDRGLVLGLAGSFGHAKNADFLIGGEPQFFVFDPRRREIVLRKNLNKEYGPLTGGQAPRVMAKGPDGKVYVLFQNCIARVDPTTLRHEKVVDSPVPIHVGVAIIGDVIYFASGGSLWGYRLP